MKRENEQNKRDISDHYDISNIFFKEILGSKMIYTVTHFNTFKENLNKSEENKLNRIGKLLKENKVAELLEIGCGWGSTLIYLAKKFKIRSLGITLSKEQCKYVRNKVRELKLEKYIKIQLIDFFCLDEHKKKYDAILSIGVMCHIKRKVLPRYYLQINKLLKEDGIYYQDSITRGIYQENAFSGGRFMGDIFFPGSEAYDLDFLFSNAIKADLEVISMKALRLHYIKTLELWLAKLDKIKKNKFSEKIIKKWRLGLTGAKLAFAEGYMNNYEMVFKKYDRQKK
jgi:cyclopropane-fatty-acyl-phospholipid synthase